MDQIHKFTIPKLINELNKYPEYKENVKSKIAKKYNLKSVKKADYLKALHDCYYHLDVSKYFLYLQYYIHMSILSYIDNTSDFKYKLSHEDKMMSDLIRSLYPSNIPRHYVYLYSGQIRWMDYWGNHVPSNVLLVFNNHNFMCQSCYTTFKRGQSYLYFINGMNLNDHMSHCSACIEDMINKANLIIIELCQSLAFKYVLLKDLFNQKLDRDVCCFIFKLLIHLN